MKPLSVEMACLLGIQNEIQAVCLPSLVQIITRRSWEQLAIIDRLDPIDGAHATSRTQSEWPSSLPLASATQFPDSS